VRCNREGGWESVIPAALNSCAFQGLKNSFLGVAVNRGGERAAR